MRFIVCCLPFILICNAAVYAQHDSSAEKRVDSSASNNTQANPYVMPDSVAVAEANHEQFVADSLAMMWFKPDPMRENQFLIQIFKNNIANIDSLFDTPLKQKANLKSGLVRETRDPWIIVTIIGLLA